tara:strand:- start:904 stop:1530 length:627 start_codon:yes stop_codon:yes gene_type:complete
MKVTELEKRMKHRVIVYDKIVGIYKIPLKLISDLNKKYEAARNHLTSYGPRLAGRLNSELDIIPIIQKTTAFKKITDCVSHYIDLNKKYGILVNQHYNLDIQSCWINDMIQNEYNPPHTHHNNTGYSTVLFLKVPKFIDDTKDPHKFKDGQLSFVNCSSNACSWHEPKVGDFYIFKADHMHSVMPFKTKTFKEIRRSMSFNFIIKNKT